MKVLRRICALTAFAVATSFAPNSHAVFHFWDISEIYSNHDGSVQFIEFFTASGGQELLDFHNIVATSTVGGTPTVKTFTFVGDLSLAPPNPSSTANRRMLIATAGFGGLAGGRTPDYTLDFTPAGGPFFNPNADTITLNFAHNTDVVTFAGSALPKNGVNSLIEAVPSSSTQTFVSGINSPTNFPNPTPPGSGSISLSPTPTLAGDFNMDGAVNGSDLALWRANYGTSASATRIQGDSDSDGDVDGRDFLVWQRGGSPAVPAASAVPEPAGAVLAIITACAALAQRRHRSG